LEVSLLPLSLVHHSLSPFSLSTVSLSVLLSRMRISLIFSQMISLTVHP
jgi:hypothetical protein